MLHCISCGISRYAELYGRDAIRASKRISNPGCYATAGQLLIAPLVQHLKAGSIPTIFGVSGYSGAGTDMVKDPNGGKPETKPKVTAETLEGGIRPYKLTGHIHEYEIGHHLSKLANTGVEVAFIPSVAPWFSGIIATVSIPLSDTLSAKDVINLFEEKYKGEKLIKFMKDVPEIKHIRDQHGWVVGGFQVTPKGDRVVIVGGVDNLLKGAATQCLQVRYFYCFFCSQFDCFLEPQPCSGH